MRRCFACRILRDLRAFLSVFSDERGKWRVIFPGGLKTYWLPYSKAKHLHVFGGGRLIFRGDEE